MNSYTNSGQADGISGRTSRNACDLHWLLNNLADGVPGILSVVVVASDGMALLASDSGQAGVSPDDERHANRKLSADLGAIVAGLGALTDGAAELVDGGTVRQTVITMADGSLFVMSISDGSLLGAFASPECDPGMVGYQMARFVGRAGHALTPELRDELRQRMQG
ncbi:roadblock/LC7 domain-containing protein [Streptomyces bathyalis]|uniref:roadblock/LC7 domain-containing protein n=1 Tax=Streptomyces bathyalis TaxID=2710756 RepID=UPI001FEA6501|nr:roadblock/LC7 domain-containing protein [Streptomyces bathyalis]